MQWKSLHTSTSNIIGCVLIGVLGSTLASHWWSCMDGPVEIAGAVRWAQIMCLSGVVATSIAYYFKKDAELKYLIELALRVMLVYAVITTALLKAEGHFYSYTLFNGETKLSSLEANTFANAFYGFSPMFQAYIGYIIIAGLALICFKGTQRIGNLVLMAILANAVIHNVSFESCYVYKNSIYLAVVGYFVFCDFPAYLSFFSRDDSAVEQEYHPLAERPHLRNSAVLLKVILLVGLYMYNHDYIEDIKDYNSRNAESPITGVWNIDEVRWLTKSPEVESREVQNFNSIILDKGRYGAVEVGDSLSFFEYLIVPEDNQLEIWNFQDYYDLDIKGTYEYLSPDTILYTGRNNQDSLQISLKRIDE